MLEFDGDFSKQFNELLIDHVNQENYNSRMERIDKQQLELTKKSQKLLDKASSKIVAKASVWIQFQYRFLWMLNI